MFILKLFKMFGGFIARTFKRIFFKKINNLPANIPNITTPPTVVPNIPVPTAIPTVETNQPNVPNLEPQEKEKKMAVAEFIWFLIKHWKECLIVLLTLSIIGTVIYFKIQLSIKDSKISNLQAETVSLENSYNDCLETNKQNVEKCKQSVSSAKGCYKELKLCNSSCDKKVEMAVESATKMCEINSESCKKQLEICLDKKCVCPVCTDKQKPCPNCDAKLKDCENAMGTLKNSWENQ